MAKWTISPGDWCHIDVPSRDRERAMALDWRRALDDSVTARTFEQRDLHPFARAHRAGERDLSRGFASGTH
jgi:hypothetical protein